MKVFVLKDSGSEGWSEINERDIDKWIKDGSIKAGDLIVIPKTVMRAVAKTEIELREEHG
jgi:hypothetical protein